MLQKRALWIPTEDNRSGSQLEKSDCVPMNLAIEALVH